MLAAAGLVEVGSQPSGALDGKIVYTHAGHGITWDNGAWRYQRPLLLDMVEDLGNQDQMTFFADQAFNAGATVVPLRPVGNQTNEVVLDNDDAEVTFTGNWIDSGASVYFGDAGDVPYRFAVASATETATAVYRPNLPEEGFYPVYTWASAGTNRADDQLYRVHHSGGATEVTVDHSRVGNGLVYLGTYHFEAGNAGYVEISNRSDDVGRVVIADMIRFGNGMGDIDRGGGVSGQPRENEAGLYWVEWHVERSQGIPTSEYRTSSNDRTATVSLSPRYAEYMNQAGAGTLSDRVFVSYHSNAGGGSSRGILALLNGNNRPSAATPNQFLLADTLGRSVNDDLVAQNGSFEHNWFNRTTVTLDRTDIEFGEINNEVIGNEFDATIIETGFHDNTLDAQMLRDPRVRTAIAKSTVQGLINYFDALDTTTPNIDPPPEVTGLRAETNAAGSVTLTWTPGTPSSFAGDAPTEFVVYASTNGYGFDGGTVVAGGGTTTTTITGLDPNETYYFRVATANTGGQSLASEVVAAAPNGAARNVLVVNGFDRYDRNLVPEEAFPTGGFADRVRPRLTNSFDYAVQVAEAIEATDVETRVDTASNEMIASGAVSLDDYDAVFWILGEESTADDTFDSAEQAAVSAYLSQGGKLFASGAEIGWDLDAQNNGRAFYNNTLRADYVADDANVYQASGVAGSIFEGLVVDFDDGDLFYNVNFPDVIAPLGGAETALDYAGAAAGAAIQFDGGDEKLVMLGFPFETITSEAIRAEAMQRVLDFFFSSATVSLLLDNDNGSPTYTETGTWFDYGVNDVDGLTQRVALAGDPATATWSTDLDFAGQARVFVRYNSTAFHADSVSYSATAVGDSLNATIDQTTQSGEWVLLGTMDAGAGPISVTLDAASSTTAGAVIAADAVRIDLSAPIPALAGDYDNNGTVEQADYDVWSTSFGQTVPAGVSADGSGDGVVNALDYLFWRENLSAPSAAAALSQEDPAAAESAAASTAFPALSIVVASPPAIDAGPAAPTVEPTPSSGDSQRGEMLLVASAPVQLAASDDVVEAGPTGSSDGPGDDETDEPTSLGGEIGAF